MVDVAALQFAGPSTLVYSLTSNNFWLHFIFLLFWIFCLQQFLCIQPGAVARRSYSGDLENPFIRNPILLHLNATKVARYVYCYKWFFLYIYKVFSFSPIALFHEFSLNSPVAIVASTCHDQQIWDIWGTYFDCSVIGSLSGCQTIHWNHSKWNQLFQNSTSCSMSKWWLSEMARLFALDPIVNSSYGNHSERNE